MDIYIKNFQLLAGEGVTVSESKKSIAKKDKQFFINMVNTLSQLDERTGVLLSLGIDMMEYENPQFELIEGLILKAYGPVKGGIILWWCGERKLLDSTHYNMVDKNGKGTIISNLNQLYNFLNKLE
jgi:hypothetical protein